MRLGFTYPESLFAPVEAWVSSHPDEIVTLFLLATHGNAAPAQTCSFLLEAEVMPSHDESLSGAGVLCAPCYGRL